MTKMVAKRHSTSITWHACHCGCGGMETVYRGRYFWKGQYEGRGTHYLFTTHTGNMGHHVGDFKYESLTELNAGVRKHYREYNKMPRLKWHACPCGKKHMTLHFRNQQYFGRWNGFYRRVELLKGHSHQNVLGRFRVRDVENEVRRRARLPRTPKRKASVGITIP
jgi:hypothetical protein